MSLKCWQVIKHLESWARPELAENWDNAGLQVGDRNQAVNRIVLALDVETDVIDRAIAAGADFVITHHPLTMSAVSRFTTDSWLGRTIARLCRHGVSLYALHTNLDKVAGGVGEILADRLGLTDLKILLPEGEKFYKLAVFAPFEHSEAVLKAMCGAGAGRFPNYSDCSFQSRGIGQFRPLAGANPFVGRIAEVESVEEMKLETIVRKRDLPAVLSAMLEAHPYEEVAYDLYQLENRLPADAGLGRIGRLQARLTAGQFVSLVKERLGLTAAVVGGRLADRIETVAVVGGSGATLAGKAKIAGADVLVTGDMKYHDAQEAYRQGIMVVDVGHFASETVVLGELCRRLRQAASEEGWGLADGDIYVDDAFAGYMKIW
ncbi:MAG: Nif3-like dinuclear metal center hexameric protein [Negativicutes bacterium]|nr:Nif3-like dinuclear metal center hexameric protein [Negativicutes bacterium]